MTIGFLVISRFKMRTDFKILYFISMILFPVIVSSCIGPSIVTNEGFRFKKQRGLNLKGKSFVINTIDAAVSEDDKIRLTEVWQKNSEPSVIPYIPYQRCDQWAMMLLSSHIMQMQHP